MLSVLTARKGRTKNVSKCWQVVNEYAYYLDLCDVNMGVYVHLSTSNCTVSILIILL